MVRGASLGRVKTRHRLAFDAIGAEPVHRFGREGHQSPARRISAALRIPGFMASAARLFDRVGLFCSEFR